MEIDIIKSWCYTRIMKKYGTITWNGYRLIYINGKQIQEHRIIMEEKLGRKLLKSEIVHHKNHNKLDNRVENLEVLTRREHKINHHPNIGKETRFKQIYNFNTNKIIKMYKSGLSTYKISKQIGSTQKTIERLIKKTLNIKSLYDIK